MLSTQSPADNNAPTTQDEVIVPAEIWLEQPETRAAFTPSEGLCCTAWRVQRDGAWHPIFAEPPSWQILRARPAWYGQPLLFPYAYGVRGGELVYQGKRHPLRRNREEQWLHGLVRDHAWRVEDTWQDSEGAHLRASITVGAGDPASDDLLAEYPFPFCLTTTYSLCGMQLGMRFSVTNLGSGPLPMGLGLHPYFPLPWAPGAKAPNLVIRCNASYQARMVNWRLQGWEPITPERDLRPGQPLDTHLATMWEERFGLSSLYAMDLPGSGGAGSRDDIVWSLLDRESGQSIDISASPAFRFTLNFVPPKGGVLSPVISTCAPEALTQLDNANPGGIIELESGETWNAWARMSVAWNQA